MRKNEKRLKVDFCPKMNGSGFWIVKAANYVFVEIQQTALDLQRFNKSNFLKAL